MPSSLHPYTSARPLTWTILFLGVLLWSGINPKDFLTWVLEVAPGVIGFIALVVTRKSFPLTSLSYILILLFCWILFVGGHYTYAEVPLFDTIRDMFNQSRNNFDKLGHFAQGFVPAMVCREIVVRLQLIRGKFFTFFFTVCFCLALSAFYELLEWWVALISEEAAEAFLGTQGYVWDTQSDMAWALSGAIIALTLLGKLQDRQIQQLQMKTA